MSHDPVNNPAHYNVRGIEVIDVIETYAKSDFRLANVIKYVCRSDYKGKKLEDLRKAQWYLNRVVKELEDEAVHEHFDAVYVQPSQDRIAGDNEAAKRIKNRYYKFDPGETRYQCSNPSCSWEIKSSDTPLVDSQGRFFCSSVCAFEEKE